MEKIKIYLYTYAKERYLWEHSRKSDLNSNVTIPLGILIAQITGSQYFFFNFPKKTCSGIFIIFIILLVLSIISLISSFILFCRHQIGYEYVYIFSPKEMINYFQNNIAEYTNYNDDVDYEYIYDELKETELSEYIEATEKNIENNKNKTKFYRHFLLSLIISTFLLVLTLFINLLLDKI